MKHFTLKTMCMAVFTAMALTANAAVTPLTLPHTWGGEDGSAAYTEELGCTASVDSKDYAADPKLKFNKTGAYLIIQLADAPDQLTYNIKLNGNAEPFTNVFEVLESADGETYTEVEKYDIDNPLESNKAVTGVAHTLKADTRYIKFVYTKKESGNIGLGSISITAGSTSGIATPTISVNSGNYYEKQTVTLDCATEGAKIYYTTDNTEPTAASTEYVQPIEINKTTTLKVVAVSGGKQSNVAEAVYTFPTEVADIAAFSKLAQGTFCKITGTLTVVFNDGNSNLYVEDESGSLLIYDYDIVKKDLTNGKTLTGIIGTHDLYNDAPQMKTVVYTPEVDEGKQVEPEVVTAITPEQVHDYVMFKSVEFDKEYDLSEAKKDAKLADGTVIRTNFKNLDLGTVKAGMKYDVTGFVAVYKGNAQLYPTAIVLSGETGVKEVLADKVRFDGQVLYNSDNRMLMVYNLAGVMVAQGTDNLDLGNLADGIYLVRSGKSAMKIVKR